MAFDFSAVLKGVEAAIPVAAKAVQVFKKKPKEVQQAILEAQASPQITVIREPGSFGLFEPKTLLVLGAVGLAAFFLLRRR